MVENKLYRLSLCCPNRQTDTDRETILSQLLAGGSFLLIQPPQHLDGSTPELQFPRKFVCQEDATVTPNPQITGLFAITARVS